ncbi:MAG: 50S ribosomal protein L4 [Dehalogenimonas sp.]|jgi:large subunit ribosomal protein L4|uniref:Large ribosomal subunit protein uL4 n=1 Tax=Candidatus Dehalogenimonas loeffleri TaxID=3127115 RepID=A0ABZ2J5Z7_9CHLR|nr:50S ribosomal protein L4 [Dehalogenimonas sp.]
MEIPVYNTSGQVVKNITISEALFGVPMNDAVVHQAMVAQAANGRQGTSSTKTRSEVAGSTRKIFRQKGTGEARAGSRNSGLRPGGGVIFGPKPRDYSKGLPKKMRQLAIRCLLSDKVSNGGLKVVESFSFEAPRTRDMVAVLKALEIGSSTIIATAGVDSAVVMSARNLPKVKTTPANQLNVVDLLKYDQLLLTEQALEVIQQVWGTEAA